MKDKQLQIRVSSEDVSLVLRALEKAQKETLHPLNKSSLIIWLVKMYLKEDT